MMLQKQIVVKKIAPGETLTRDLPFARRVLYTTELQGQNIVAQKLSGLTSRSEVGEVF